MAGGERCAVAVSPAGGECDCERGAQDTDTDRVVVTTNEQVTTLADVATALRCRSMA
jgi:hypothetical protein